MTDLERLISQSDIRDLMFRYARAVDRRDWESVRLCFHPDALDHHGDVNGDVEAFMRWVTKAHESIHFSSHFLANSLIQFASDDRALVETYFNLMMRIDSAAPVHVKMFMNGTVPSGQMDLDVIGRYIDIFESREGFWRIAKRTVTFDATRMRPAQAAAMRSTWSVGTRDFNDPIFRFRKDIGLT
jgi:hypothetical protein